MLFMLFLEKFKASAYSLKLCTIFKIELHPVEK